MAPDRVSEIDHGMVVRIDHLGIVILGLSVGVLFI